MTDSVSQSSAPDDLEIVPGFAHEKLQGWIPELASEQELREALEKAFDYRGDVTLIRKDGASVEGYIFDRRHGDTLDSSLVRILPADGTPRQSVAFSQIAGLKFSGRDNAAGKSWEAWIRKYWDKKEVGESAVIEPEALD